MGLEYKAERDAEFFRTCERTRREKGGYLSVREIVKRAILEPASSFFISEREFGRIVRDKKHHVPHSGPKAELYSEIRRRYRRVKADFPQMKDEAVARSIAYGRAPRFYISEERARKLYCLLLSKCRRK
jgi:hypothetical protein